MRAAHRFYIERDGSSFNMPNVYRFPKKKFLRYAQIWSFATASFQLLIQGYIAVVPLLISYILVTNIMFMIGFTYANFIGSIFRLGVTLFYQCIFYLCNGITNMISVYIYTSITFIWIMYGFVWSTFLRVSFGIHWFCNLWNLMHGFWLVKLICNIYINGLLKTN